MSKRKCKTGIFLLIILLISALFPPIETQNVYAEESGPKQLQELEQGEEIIFASAEWIVLEPSEGYILRKESIGNRQFDNGTSLSNRFDPSDASNLAHYLNGDYYDEAFTSAEQAVIEERIWGIGDETDENADQVNTNIGLLSYGEWEEYSKFYNSSNGFLDNPEREMWLRTPSSSRNTDVWYVGQTGILGACHVSVCNFAVRPALTLKSDIFVLDEKELIVADITFDPNGTGDTWTQEHETTVTVNKFVKASDVQYTWSTETTKPNEEEDWKALEVNEEGRAKSIKTPEKATGEYYLHMQGKDITDRDFHIHSKVFKIDNRNPTAPSIDTPKVNGGIVADVNNFTHAFSITKAGTHSLTVTAADKAGNQAEETRTIRIDQTPPSKPVIQLSAEGWTNAEVVTATITAGEDQESGVDQTQYRIGEGEWAAYDQPLSIDEAGETKIEARTIDQAGNISDIAEVIVKIKRNIPAKPVIHVETSDWTNAEMVSVELTTDEAGGTLEYQLNDTEEGWLTYTEGMAISEEGITKIYARVVDQAGNVSEVAEAMVKIDRHAPTLTLLGDNPMYVGYKEIFEDPGYEVEDNFTEDVTVKVTGEVNTSQVDVYELTYKVQDMAGNETSKTRSVHVVYEESPIILLDGENPLILEVGTAYEEPGATATDQAGNDISEQMEITDTIDTSKLGSYQVTYEVEDDSGNKSKATRNVEVVDTTAPEITLNGEAEITLELGDSYQEAGAVASDNYDGNLNEAIRITGDVLTNKTGTYHVTYTVTDSSNNVASVTRTVYVIDTTAPNDVTLEITEVTTEKITFIFSAQDAGGIKEYILSRNGIEITRINGEATTYTDQTVEAGTTYLYKLEAIDPSGNAASATVEITTKEAEPTQGAPIEVNYVDETGKAVAEPEKLTGNLGEAYKTEPKIITGYQLIETPENATGTFTEEAQTVIYVYALIEEEPTQGAPIEVNYVDETGKAVAEPEKLTGNLGEAYKTEPKIITGYQLIETPENATGTFTEEAQTVIYVYAPIEEEPTQGAPIEVNYVDETGKAVAEPEKLTGNLGEAYKTEPKIITGYQLIETPENATGTFTEEAQTVTYVYALIVEEPTQGAPIEVNYVDETGKAVAEPEKLTGNLGEAYKTEPKVITGYQLIETPENATGTFTEEAQTVTYVYALIVEEPKESEVPETIEIILDGSPVEVYPGITVIVKDTQTTIQLPDDLPAGTLLQVLTTQLETQEGLTQAGEVYDFVFTYPKGEKDYTGEFILTMGVTETSDQTALYHYQKDSQKWERIGGTRENDVITATVTHFSIYGVLLEETVSPIPEEETPEPKEPSEQQPTESSKEKQTPKPKETEDSNPPEKDSKKEKSPALSPTTDTTAVTGAAEQTINLQENSDKTTTAGDLPHTATQQYNWLLAGIALLLLGGGSALWFRHKKD